jgi:pimeloyl-ACP methyl ester carboxylesterase
MRFVMGLSLFGDMFITMVRTTWVRTSAGNVACAMQGAGGGPPVVLLHANAGDRRDFDAIAGRLAVWRRVIALDWPGCGLSVAPRDPRRVSAMQYAAVLVEVLDALGVARAAFIGNSVGGYAALRLAIEQPARVAAMVLVSPGGFTHMTASTRLFCRLRGQEWVARLFAGAQARWQMRHRTPVVEAMIRRAESQRRDPTRVAVDAAVWRSFAHPEHDLRERAKAVTAPTLLAWGEHDPVLRIDREGRAAQAAMPHARLVPFDAGHAPFAEVPDAFLAVVEPFLDETLGRPRVIESLANVVYGTVAR